MDLNDAYDQADAHAERQARIRDLEASMAATRADMARREARHYAGEGPQEWPEERPEEWPASPSKRPEAVSEEDLNRVRVKALTMVMSEMTRRRVAEERAAREQTERRRAEEEAARAQPAPAPQAATMPAAWDKRVRAHVRSVVGQQNKNAMNAVAEFVAKYVGKRFDGFIDVMSEETAKIENRLQDENRKARGHLLTRVLRLEAERDGRSLSRIYPGAHHDQGL